MAEVLVPSPDSLEFKGDYVDGAFLVAENEDQSWVIVSPGDTKDIVVKATASYSHIDRACLAAKAAFLPWAAKTQNERTDALIRLKEIFGLNEERIAICISRETGKPLWESRQEAKALSAKIDITVNHSSRWIREERFANALPNVEGVVRFKPRGVMAVLGPFNFPAHLPNGHFIPALFAGNTVVFKPSDKTPGVGQILAECFDQAQFPSGVFNMIQGQAEVGKRLSEHEHVDGVLFTGSYEVGLKIKQSTLHHYWKILALEMGGKNCTVVWEDADLEKAVAESLVGAFLSAGQRCSCTSKIILHASIREKFLERFYSAAKKISIGHWRQNPFMGSLISSEAVEKYVRFQEIAKREGAEVLMRGKALDLNPHGFYVTPSIYLVPKFNVKSVYQNTELFAPNVAVFSVSEFSEAMTIVNSSGFGLALAVFSRNRALYERALLEARVGLLNWNRTTNGASSKLPFGGMGKSGNDRPSADFAVQYCTVPVASLEDLNPLDRAALPPGLHLDFEGELRDEGSPRGETKD